MNPHELLRLVDSLHREKNIDSEIVFAAIESALVTAMRRFRGEEAEIDVRIDRNSGTITAVCDGQELDQAEIGRIGAQTAKQVIIQKIKEAERDSLMEEFHDQIGQLVTGTVQRSERGVTTVQLSSVEAILPRGEQIPGESYHNGDRVRAVVYEVKAAGNRVKVILSRTKPQLVQRLFEQEIPEIIDGVIEIRAISREPGQRSKVAVTSSDTRVDCVGACVGVRGNRIKNITSELAGERIDIVRWNDDPQVMIPASLQPAEVEQVLLCDMIGRAIVLVRDDQLSQAIGKFGQNVRLASKLVGWDIEIMTTAELEEQIDRAVSSFMELQGMTEDLAQRLVEQGYLSYDDLSVIEPDHLMEMGGLTAEEVDVIVEQADERVAEAERVAEEEKQLKKQRELAEQQAAAQAASRGSVHEAPTAVLEAQSPSGDADLMQATDDSSAVSDAPEETMDQSNDTDRN
ncbi:MAG: transcription termination factor NusA [Pirellulaceae bacterium]|nr:transcription termination factor NusA [Pirellulaceae bacterium]